MAEPIHIEMQPQQKSGTGFLRGWRKYALGVLLLLVIGCAGFSWWLANGKVSSAFARVDAIVYTVGPQYASSLETLYADTGGLVSSGQSLAKISVSAGSAPDNQSAATNSQGASGTAMGEVSERLANAQLAEKKMAAQVAEARHAEESAQKFYQDAVTAHVRAQLYLRSLHTQNRAQMEQAIHAESAARARMNEAKAAFEQSSKMRAAMDVELGKLRYEIMRNRKKFTGNIQAKPAQPQPATTDDTLYSPVSGKILSVLASPGQNLKPGEPLFVILPDTRANSEDLWIQAWFPINSRSKLMVGQKASILLQNDTHISGKISAISQEAQNLPEAARDVPGAITISQGDTPTYGPDKYLPVRIQLDNSANLSLLKPGAEVQCQIQTRYLLGEAIF